MSQKHKNVRCHRIFTKMNATQADTMMQVRGDDYASWLHVALYNGVN